MTMFASIRSTQPRREASKGVGLNSIPVRFALMSMVFTAIVAIAVERMFRGASDLGASAAFSLAVIVATPALITFLAASKLAGNIHALRRSTEAIVAGDFDSPVHVDCNCEVGGLADTFRAMVDRLNNNIVRMNLLAYTDAVTGLPNRSVIQHVLGLAARRGSACQGAVLFIDLDDFKRINDTLGHEAGDELLRQVSRRIAETGLGVPFAALDTCRNAFGELCTTCPTSPVLSRFAGDEFVLMLPGETEIEPLRARAERIVAALREPFLINGVEAAIGASVGVARTPQDTEDPQQLLGFADLAMYTAKARGKNGVVFFDAALKALAIERSELEGALRKAIEADELELHFQPKVDATSLEPLGYEALARWRGPKGVAVPPSVFVAIAERSGLMRSLGSCIFRLAATRCRQWMQEGRPRRVAINVSPAQFEDPNIVAEVAALIAEHRLDPSLLELEVTESLLMSDAGAMKRVEQIRELGVRISLDDFGAGYSNLSQLAHLPATILKVDRSLIENLEASPKNRTILTATVRMAQALGHRIVAEGVETPRQLAFLREIGCDEIQGYLIGKPMPADAVPVWEAQRAAPERACA